MSGLEMLPFVEGVLLGLLLGRMKPKTRMRLGGPLAVVLGALATIASGELQRSWAFLVVDVALVALTAGAALLAMHRLGGARRDAGARVARGQLP